MMKKTASITLAFYLFTLLFSSAYAYSDERKGRLGIGYSNQLKIDVPALSVSKSTKEKALP